MFVRKKNNPSGVISVQVIDKSLGKYRVVKTIGSSSAHQEVEVLVLQAKEWIKTQSRQLEFDFTCTRAQTESLLDHILQIRPCGIELLLSPLFDSIGFNAIPDDLFRRLALLRLSYPVSKMRAQAYLSRHHYLHLTVWQIYRYLDRLHRTQKGQIQEISYRHVQKILGGEIRIVFYDVTTLYFESDAGDDLRTPGFSKEGRHQNPQILLGLLVSIDGYPLAYEIFEGNKFEGHTMLPVIEEFKKKYKIEQMVVVADSGLMSDNNVSELADKGYEFILGARIKNESRAIKEKILSLKLSDGQTAIVIRGDLRLIIGYSELRAKKDRYNREKGLFKLEKKIHSGRLTKAHINNKGYNKYLKMEGDVYISIDRTKLGEDARWDGLKGYLTNSTLSNAAVMENYKQLWKIEKAFRVNKHNLKIRPVFHRVKRRIEAHICISFVAYMLYKELERQLKMKGSVLSPERALEIAESIYAIAIKVPNSNEIITKTIVLSDEQKMLANLFNF
jgi:transposase